MTRTSSLGVRFHTSAVLQTSNLTEQGNLDEQTLRGAAAVSATNKDIQFVACKHACKCQSTRNVKLESNARAAASRRRQGQASLHDPRPQVPGARHSLALRLRDLTTPHVAPPQTPYYFLCCGTSILRQASLTRPEICPASHDYWSSGTLGSPSNAVYDWLPSLPHPTEVANASYETRTCLLWPSDYYHWRSRCGTFFLSWFLTLWIKLTRDPTPTIITTHWTHLAQRCYTGLHDLTSYNK